MSAELVSAFLDDIVANIDDDTPRLVYADWLTEHGHDDRAELIRVQVEMSRLPSWDVRRVWLSIRERQLLDANGERWLAEMPKIDGVVWEGFRRGIVAEASFADFEAFRRQAAQVRKVAPMEAARVRWPRYDFAAGSGADVAELRELSLTGRPVTDEVERLADSPQLATLRVLTARGLDAYLIRRLAASPYLGELKALRLPVSALGNEGIDALVANNRSMRSLEELDLSGPGGYQRYNVDPIINARGIQALVAWPGLASLRSLTLSGNDVRSEGLRDLLRAKEIAGLKDLRIRNAYLSDETLLRFTSTVAGLRLDVLDLGENIIEDAGVAHLAASAGLADGKELRLDRGEIKLAGAKRLAAAPFFAGLRHLDVGHNWFGPAGLSAILDAAPPHLHSLRINDNDLFDKGAKILAASPASDALVRLDLGENSLTSEAALTLGESSHLANLAVLRLSGNAIGGVNADALRESPLGRRVAYLTLDDPPPPEPEADFLDYTPDGPVDTGNIGADIPF